MMMLIQVAVNCKVDSGFGNSGHYLITKLLRLLFELIPSFLGSDCLNLEFQINSFTIESGCH